MTSAAPPVTLSPEHRQRLTRWVEALESGRYLQGKGQLGRITNLDDYCDGRKRDSVRYCCLGVLCEVAITEGFPLERRMILNDIGYEADDGVSWFEHLPPTSVLNFFGLASSAEKFDSDVVISNGLTAAVANDTEKLTFEEIATLVRDYYGLGQREH